MPISSRPSSPPPTKPPPLRLSLAPRGAPALPSRRPSPGARPDLEDTLVATDGGGRAAHGAPRAALSGVLAERYHVRGRLDEGGEGVIYDAWDQLEQRPLALKVRSRLVGHDHLLLKREYQALSAVRHANVARAFDFVEDQERGLAFFTMELVMGVDFVAHVRRPAPPHVCQADLGRLRRMTRQVALGLRAIHATGRAHRDIKPSNILVTEADRAVILDFGLAARLSGGSQLTLRAPRVEGTPHYMAPEQLCADAPITAACDCYALGVVLYEALTGRWPLDAESLTELITLKHYRAPKPPSALVRDLPPELDALVMRLLAREPADRADLAAVLAWCGHAAQPPAPSLAPPAQPSPAAPPLLSHRRPLARLAGALRLLRRREPRTLLLHGPAGAGKSGLVRRALTTLREHVPSALVLSGRCNPRESVPFRAFDAIIDALSAFLLTCPKDQLDDLLSGGSAHLAQLFPVFARVPGVDPPPPLGERPAARDRAFHELRALFQRLAVARPLILFIDDLHRSDRDSLRLLGALTGPAQPPAMLVIATLRASAAEAEKLATDLHGDRELVEVRLPTPEEAQPIAHASLCAAGLDDPELAAALAAACEGDVRLITRVAELVARRAPEAQPRRSLRLADLIAPALADLDPLARRLLDLIALAELATPIDVLVHASAARGRARAQLTALRDRRLIEIEADVDDPDEATAECISPALRGALLDLLPEARRAELHRALAAAHHSSERGDEERCARHLIAIGDHTGARDHAANAALIATHALAFDHAAQLFELALRCDPSSRELRLKLASALTAAGDLSAAARHYLLVARDAAGRRRLGLATTAADLFFLSGDQDRGRRAADAVFSELGLQLPDDPVRARQQLDRQLALLDGHPLDFCAHTRAQIGGEFLQRIDAMIRLGRHLRDGDPVTAALVLVPAVLDALSVGEPRLIIQTLALTAATVVAYHRPLAARLLARATELAGAAGDERSAGLTALASALIALHDSDPLAALSALTIAEDALVTARIADRWEQRALTLARLAVYESLGELRALGAALQALQSDPIAAADPNIRPWLDHYHGLLLLADGEAERAELRAVARSGELAARDPALALALTARVAALSDLLRGLPRKAWSRVIGPKGQLRANPRRAADPRLPAAAWPLLDARIALACAVLKDTRERPHYRAVLDHSLLILDQLAARAPAHSGLHGEIALLRAGLAHLEGAPALPHLRRADAHFLSASMSTARAVAQLRLGEHQGGRGGALLAANARQQLRRQGITDPDRWADTYAPGLRRPQPITQGRAA
jgi:serine/threonine protein kinase